MEFITIVYIVVLSVMAFSIGLVVLIIAGKDIFFAMYRWAFRKGSDVYMTNPSRNVSYYYKVPRDGVFKIKGNTYITNPDKCSNLSEVDKIQIVNSIKKTNETYQKRIDELNKKVKFLKSVVDKLKDDSRKNTYNAEIRRLQTIIQTFKDKQKQRTQNYFKDKRSCFFYIEGDPVPKDFFEFYSALDCKIIDNLVCRSISKPPDVTQDKDFKLMKLALFGALIAAGLACYFAFTNQAKIVEVCRGLGVVC